MTRQRAVRSDATANRVRIIDTARVVFDERGAATSMAEVARRSGVGQATLYRNFATRHELLEALLLNEVDALTASASPDDDELPVGDQLERWLRRLFRYVTVDRPVALDLLAMERSNPAALITETRQRLAAVGAPLLRAAQDAGQFRHSVDFEQVVDLVMAVAKIRGDAAYRSPLIGAALRGLRTPAPDPYPMKTTRGDRGTDGR